MAKQYKQARYRMHNHLQAAITGRAAVLERVTWAWNHCRPMHVEQVCAARQILGVKVRSAHHKAALSCMIYEGELALRPWIVLKGTQRRILYSCNCIVGFPMVCKVAITFDLQCPQ